MTRVDVSPALLLVNAVIEGHSGCDAVLIEDGRVAAVGPRQVLASSETAERDVRGGSILPGFVDAHTHLVESGLAAIGWRVDLADCGREEALQRIAAASRRRGPAEWLIAVGWDESRWKPSVPLLRADLDWAAAKIPAVAVRIDGHLAVANSRALHLARSGMTRFEGLIEAETGHVREAAVSALLAWGHPEDSVVDDALRAAASVCHRLGITTAHVMTGSVEPERVRKAGRDLRLRLVVHPPIECLEALARAGIASGQGDGWGSWGGLKVFADGSIGAHSAAVSDPYLGGGRGMLVHPTSWLSQRIALAERFGWQTLTHAIGDRAIAQALEAHRNAGSSSAFRHRIEHFELPTEDQMRETARLGIEVCMQPNFIGNWSGAGRLYDQTLGAKRDSACNPLSAIHAEGIRLVFGSDGMPLSPLYGIACAVRPPHQTQRLSLDDALWAYTRAVALSGRGTASSLVMPGESADLVVLTDPVDADTIGRTSIAMTLVGGEIVYDADGG